MSDPTPTPALSLDAILGIASPILGSTLTIILTAIRNSQASDAAQKAALLQISAELTGHVASHLALVPLDTKDPANLPPPNP